MEGLEDDPDFWNMSIDSDEDEKMKDDEDKDIVIKDLTGPRGWFSYLECFDQSI